MRKVILCLALVLTYGSAIGKRFEAKIITNYGDITVVLYDDTPSHRDNFVKLAREGFYDSLLFHRVIDNFMIQAGDPNSKHASMETFLGGGEIGYTITQEIKPKNFHKMGVLAAARIGDDLNPAMNSSGCQFYITVAPMGQLNGKYTVYGEVIDGMDIATKISKTRTDKRQRPRKEVRIKTIEIYER